MKKNINMFVFISMCIFVISSCSNGGSNNENTEQTSEYVVVDTSNNLPIQDTSINGSTGIDTGLGTDSSPGSDNDSGADSSPGSDNDSGADSSPDSDNDSGADSSPDSDTVPFVPLNCDPNLDHFSFFVMSMESIVELSGSANGFGGNLGGITGADEKCQITAESVGSCRNWRAFLSVTDDGSGNSVHAIERIGNGPWYDVNGHLLSENIDGLLHTRPQGSDEVVFNDGWVGWTFSNCLTTELGNCNLSYGDSHDTLTGSDRDGRLYSTDSRYTCNDWTSDNVRNIELPIGHTWPRGNNVTNIGGAHWIYAHTICQPRNDCNPCGANFNLLDTREDGIGGMGGYGAWYCFAYD